MKNKILFVRTAPYEFNPYTYNVQGIGMGKAFVKQGYDFDFLYLTKHPAEAKTVYEENGHSLRVLSRNRMRFFRTGLCSEICTKEFLDQYDYIISCEYDQLLTYQLSKYSDNVVMYSGPYYNLFLLPFISPIYDAIYTRKINRNVKYKFVKSELAKEFLSKKGYDNIHVLGVGLDTDKFNEQPQKSKKTAEVEKYMTDSQCMLYVGALIKRKNFDFLLKLFKQARAEYPGLKLVAVGKGKEKYVDQCLKQLTDEERKNVFLPGQIDNSQLRYIYPLAKIFALPSLQEIFGMVLMEAMYFGVPVITSRNGGSVTLINNGVNGSIVNEFRVEDWMEKIRQYMDDEKHRTMIVENARETIKESFNWMTLTRKMINIMDGTYNEQH